MDNFNKKEIMQAILIADNNVENFRPLSDTNSMALMPLVNVTMLDYALEALNRSGMEEVFVFTSLYIQNVRDHIQKGVDSLSSWSVNMKIHVIGGEGCRCFGDAMRELDAKGLIRGNFILLGADTITSTDFGPIFEQHKKTVKYDKGAAATLIFKEAGESHQRTGNEVMIAIDVQNKRLHHHQRLSVNEKESYFDIPLEVFLHNSQVALLHNVLDPQMAIGSPSMLSLFSDNFDFQTRDDFVRGILINEEILDSRIYVSLLPRGQYARKITNWLTYQIVSNDIMNRWSYPLVPDMGIIELKQQYIFYKNNIYKSPTASLAKVTLNENVVVNQNSVVGAGSTVSNSVIGQNAKVGQNCRIFSAFLLDNVVIEDNCILEYCIVGKNTVVKANSELREGCVIGESCLLPEFTKLASSLVKNEKGDSVLEKLSDAAYNIDYSTISENDVDHKLAVNTAALKMMELNLKEEESDYDSSNDEEESQEGAPLPDDANIFLSEVVESLDRAYLAKSVPDFIILEINSSRHAYNMSLKEVNFLVVKAIFSLPSIQEPPNGNILNEIDAVLKQLGPIMLHYIKSEDSMLDCLKALEDIYVENKFVGGKISQIVHYLYDKDFVTEDSIFAWYEQLDEEDHGKLRRSLIKLIEWLKQSSDEDDDSD